MTRCTKIWTLPLLGVLLLALLAGGCGGEEADDTRKEFPEETAGSREGPLISNSAEAGTSQESAGTTATTNETGEILEDPAAGLYYFDTEDGNGDGLIQSGEIVTVVGRGFNQEGISVTLAGKTMRIVAQTDDALTLTAPVGMPSGEYPMEITSSSSGGYLRIIQPTQALVYVTVDESADNFWVFPTSDLTTPTLRATLSNSSFGESGGNVGVMSIDNFCEQIFVHRPARREVTAIERTNFTEVAQIPLNFDAGALATFPDIIPGISGFLYITDLTNNALHYYQLTPLVDGNPIRCPVMTEDLTGPATYPECTSAVALPPGFSRPVSIDTNCHNMYVAVGAEGEAGVNIPGVVLFNARVADGSTPTSCSSDPNAVFDTLPVHPGDPSATDAYFIDVKYDAFERLCTNPNFTPYVGQYGDVNCDAPSDRTLPIDCCPDAMASGLLLFTNNHLRYLYIVKARVNDPDPTPTNPPDDLRRLPLTGELELLPNDAGENCGVPSNCLTGIRLDDVWPVSSGKRAPKGVGKSPAVVGGEDVKLRIAIGVEVALPVDDDNDPRTPPVSSCPGTPIGDACRSFAYVWDENDDGIIQTEGGPVPTPAKLVVIDLRTFTRLGDFGYVTPVDDFFFPRGVASPFNSATLFTVGRDFNAGDGNGAPADGLFLTELGFDTGQAASNPPFAKVAVPNPANPDPFRDLE